MYRDSGRHSESRELFEEVIAIQRSVWGPDHPWSVDNLQDYLELLQVTGPAEEAAALEARVRSIAKK